MKIQIRTLRITAIILLFVTGINAVIAGTLFMLDPSGALMGMNTGYIRSSPFHDYLIPGIILFSAIGLYSLLIVFMTIRKHPLHPINILLQGLILCGWILIQVIMVSDFNFLHITMLVTGILLSYSGFRLRNISEKTP